MQRVTLVVPFAPPKLPSKKTAPSTPARQQQHRQGFARATIAAQWQPWRSYATLHLWQSLKQGDGLISNTIQTQMIDSKVSSR